MLGPPPLERKGGVMNNQPPRGLFQIQWGSWAPSRWYRATGEYRVPQKGEWFLSGAIVEVYRAMNDGGDIMYWIAEPVEVVQCPKCKGLGKVEK
jgi:hypothetical protein